MEVLDRYGVEYLLVGGVSARIHGATRDTKDLDCLPRTTTENLGRLAASMRELRARLRVEGLSDEESRQLQVPIDAAMLHNMDISTWRTDAGDLDVLTGMPARDGRRQGYEELLARAKVAQVGALTIHVASLEDVIASKEWADRPKDRQALEELRSLTSEL